MIFCSAAGNWWDGLTATHQAAFILAAAASVILVVQLVMMLIGLGSDGGFDGDTSDIDGCGDLDCGIPDSAEDAFNNDGIAEAGGLRIVSFRTVVAFFALGGWITYTMAYFLPWWGAVLIGVAAGCAAAVGVAYLMRAILSFQSDGNRKMGFAVGKIAEVYLTIPAKRTGSGKISVVVQDALTECAAVTDSDEPLSTGSRCVIKAVLSEQLVLVEPMIATKPEASDEKAE